MKYTYEEYFNFIERNSDSFSFSHKKDGTLCGFSLGTQWIEGKSISDLFDEFIDAEKKFGTGETSFSFIIKQVESELENKLDPKDYYTFAFDETKLEEYFRTYVANSKYNHNFL
jgi:hypothetical protein